MLCVCFVCQKCSDQSLHSDCGWSCGFTITKRSIINPIGIALQKSSHFFPVDYIVFSMVIVWLFLCTIYGLTQIGLRVLFCKVRNTHTHTHTICPFLFLFLLFYQPCFFFFFGSHAQIFDVTPHHTLQNSLMMAIWVLIMVVSSFNIQMLILAPNYTMFGHQFYVKDDVCHTN